MKTNIEQFEINGRMYIPADSVSESSNLAPTVDGLEFCVIRTNGAGVHIGYVSSREGTEVILLNSRRLWYWEGAMTLSEVAITGITKPENCKVACVVPKIYINEVIEIIPCSEKAKKIIDNIKVWTK